MSCSFLAIWRLGSANSSTLAWLSSSSFPSTLSLDITLFDPSPTSPLLLLAWVMTLEFHGGILILLQGNNGISLATSSNFSLWNKTLRGFIGPLHFLLFGYEIKTYAHEPSSLIASDFMSINFFNLSLKLLHSSIEFPTILVWNSHLTLGWSSSKTRLLLIRSCTKAFSAKQKSRSYPTAPLWNSYIEFGLYHGRYGDVDVRAQGITK